MKRLLWCVLLLLPVLSCSREPMAQGEPLPSVLVADGIRYEATLLDQRDSVHTHIRITNTRPDSARIALEGCPVALLAYSELPRENRPPTWSERWNVGCPDLEGARMIAPGETEEIRHSLSNERIRRPLAPLAPGEELPVPLAPGVYHIAVEIGDRRPIPIRIHVGVAEIEKP